MIDKMTDPALQSYLLLTTSDESPLLAELREQTALLTQAAHMLSGPVEGKLLYLLVKLSHAKKCLEIGTFTGYSALHIAAALPPEGKLFTCEIRKSHAAIAQQYFDRSPDGNKIEILLGDASQTITSLADTFDFIFIDADKSRYLFYYEHLLPLLHPGGLMVVDNALWRGEVVNPLSKEAVAIHALNMAAKEDPRVETVMLPLRDGMLLIYKR